MPTADPAATQPLATAAPVAAGIVLVGWIVFWAWLWGWFLPAGRRRLDADDASAFFAQLGWLWTRRVHGYRIEGFTPQARALLDDPASGPIIVVCNHAAGVDPILVQLSESSPDREVLDDAAFLLAECFVDIQAYNDAKTTLRSFIRRFPDSPLLNDARMALADVSLKR